MTDTQAPVGPMGAEQLAERLYCGASMAEIEDLIRDRDAQIRAQALVELRAEIRPLLVEAVDQVGCLCPEGTDTSEGYHQSDFCNAICAIDRALISRTADLAGERDAQVRAQALEECAEMLLEHSGSDVLQWINAQLRGVQEPDHD